jgi:hypothetical protein
MTATLSGSKKILRPPSSSLPLSLSIILYLLILSCAKVKPIIASILSIKFDDLVKSPVPVIASSPANGGATWQSRYFKNLQKLDRRASLAMTPFFDFLRDHQILSSSFLFVIWIC